jgi:hypothetical protein
MCTGKEKIYMLDIAQSRVDLRDFSSLRAMHCSLKAPYERLFRTEESQELGFNQFGIKIFVAYRYEVSKTSNVRIIKRYRSDYEDIKTYTAVVKHYHLQKKEKTCLKK